MNDAMRDTRWLVRQPVAAPRMRLFCFAYAGGSAAEFLPWQTQLAPHIEVCGIQLPGRGSRWSEVAATEMTSLVEAIAQVIERHAEIPFALFGHSLGAILAFEVARHCQYRALCAPAHLFVSGCNAPLQFVGQQWQDLDDEEFVDALRQLNGTPAELLKHEELMQLVLPMLRADFGLVANYAYRSGPRLHVPITVLSGMADEHVPLESLSGWEIETHAGFDQHMFAGGHFFVQERSDEVIACLKNKLGF